ncbi:MAG: T9SS type A sorting domain-containing protein [Candidatus Cloacimonetes bacterium]|nr:T9SS type A sorting domain-containing protein [Candidatus Cloacimonadota bacterium]
MKKIFIVLLFILRTILNADWITIGNQGNLISYSQTRDDEISMEFRLDGYEQEIIRKAGEDYMKLSHPQGNDFGQPGKPGLPVFHRVIAIPDRGEVKLEILTFASYVVEDILIYPREDFQIEGETRDLFIIDEDYYQNGTIFPENIALAGDPAIMRDLRIVPVTFYPFRYNAQERSLEIFTEIEIKIDVTGNDGSNCKSRNSGLSRSFEPLYKTNVINYEGLTRREGYQQPALLFIAPDDDDILGILSILVDWKRQKGFDVTVATLAETGETNLEIKDYIQDAYDTWDNPPEHVCFVGDITGNYAIPTFYVNGTLEGDHPFGELAGDDMLLDVNLGRLSYETLNSLLTIVSKIVGYEKTPYMGNTQWYEKALLVGDTSAAGNSTITTEQMIKEMMLYYPDNWDSEDDFYEIYSSPFPSQMNDAFNNGVVYMNYQGYIGVSGWDPGPQNNSFMLPFVTLIGCVTNNFSGTSDCETLLRMGTATNPTGAIAALGLTGHLGCLDVNRWLTLGMAHAMLDENIFQVGSMLTRGKYYVWNMDPSNSLGFMYTYMNSYSLIGDPSLELWTGIPQEISVFHDVQIAEGENWLGVTVFDPNSINSENAWVTISGISPDEFAVTGFTDAAGDVLLPIPDLAPGEYILTVTKHNRIPYIDTLSVVQIEQFVDIDEVEIVEVTGNGDGLLNPGETVDLDITLRNSGTMPVTEVEAEISCDNDLVNFITDECYYGDIGANSSENPAANFTIEIDPAALEGMELGFELVISSGNEQWTTYYIAYVYGVSLRVGGIINEVLEPGETCEFAVTLVNDGSLPAENIQGTLLSITPGVEVIDGNGYFGTISSGGSNSNSNDLFTVSIGAYFLPGSLITFQLVLENTEGFEQMVSFSETAGTALLTDPYGPDAYGYYCLDDGDIEYEPCPVYDWIEIAPDMGGAGEDLNLASPQRDGAVVVVELPDGFHFSFYGEEYDVLTICSNGWIAPGEHEAATFFNWYIPGPQGPSPMIAVFWDALDTTQGTVCWLYDEQENILIIEWSNALLGNQDDPETFEVILYDSEYYPIITGDSKIKMQYLVVNNTDINPQGALYHHLYSTVGLENRDSSIGLEYTFNNIYAEANKPLENEMALFFTTSMQNTEVPFLSLGDIQITAGDDEFIEAGETVSLLFEVINTGLQAAHNINIEISTQDQYIDIIENNASIDSLDIFELCLIDTPLIFEVSENVPDFHDFDIIVNLESDEFAWVRYITLTAYEVNTFNVDVDSLSFEMDINQLESREIVLTNIGETPVNFYVRTIEIRAGERDMTGSYVSCDHETFYPGETIDWIFAVHNFSPDSEWISGVEIDFPPGVTLNSATNIAGGSGGDLEWDDVTGNGVITSWSGFTPSGFGMIHDNETAYMSLNLTFGNEFAGDIEFCWIITGDGFGAEPHETSGILTFRYPLQWINLNTSYGYLEPDESITIIANFNTFDLEPAIYEALLEITCDSWDSKRIRVILDVTNNDNEENQLPVQTMLLGNYPNPFNPSTEIRFQLAEAGLVELTIYNLRGQKVRQYKELLAGGKHSITWDGMDNKEQSSGSGIYFYRFISGKKTFSGKMLLLK